MYKTTTKVVLFITLNIGNLMECMIINHYLLRDRWKIEILFQYLKGRGFNTA